MNIGEWLEFWILRYKFIGAFYCSQVSGTVTPEINGVSKSIFHLKKRVNFQLYWAHPDGDIWKIWHVTVNKQISLIFYASNDENNVLEKKKSLARNNKCLYKCVEDSYIFTPKSFFKICVHETEKKLTVLINYF